MRESSAAMRHLEKVVTAAGGIALRYGGFYGADNDGLVGPVRKRQFPIVGDGGGYLSFIHLEDAASATVLALEHDGVGDLQRRRRRAGAGARVAARDGGRGWAPGRRATFPSGSAGCSQARLAVLMGTEASRRFECEGEAGARGGRCATPAGWCRGFHRSVPRAGPPARCGRGCGACGC